MQPVQLPPLDTVPNAPPVVESATYRLQPGDVVRVHFLFYPDLDLKVLIRPDGVITLQVAGEIHAAGLTLDELEKVIKERTSDHLREPEVSVIVAQLGDQRVYVGGEVGLPGFVPFSDGMTPLQAVMARGGFSDTARVDSVLRISSIDGQYHATRLDLAKPLSVGTSDQNCLAPGDVLYVPRTFIGDANSFVRLYVRSVLPIEPFAGFGTGF